MPLSLRDSQTFHQRIKADPLFFHYDVLGAEPLWSRQKELLLAPLKYRKIAVKAGHSVGKTYTVAELGLWWIASEPGSILITTAPSGRQVKTLLWGEMRNKFFNSKIPLGGQMDLQSWKIDEKWYALGFSTDEPVNVGGFHGKRVMVIVDEASGMSDEIMDGLESAVTGTESRMILSGNPLQAKGRFYDAFKDPSFHKMTISCLEHPNVIEGRELFPGMVSRDWVESRERRWGKTSPLYQARVAGNFPEDADDILIPIAAVEDAKENELDPAGARREAGLDVAEFGTDECVFTLREGPKLLYQEHWSKSETMTTVGRAANLMRRFNVAQIKVDCIGIGAGVTSRLKELFPRHGMVIGVNVAEAAYDTEAYQTRRDELWFGLAQRYIDRQMDCTAVKDHEELFSQLTSIKKLPVNSRGQQKVESKDSMKSRGLGSPDRADSVVLAYARVKEPPVLGTVHSI